VVLLPAEQALTDPSARVFVHCARGISRSATFVLAYLIKSQRWSVNDAYAFLRKKRRVMPNLGFMLALGEFERECGVGRGVALDDEGHESPSAAGGYLGGA
jgi:protein-tyrosine phosphatase